MLRLAVCLVLSALSWAQSPTSSPHLGFEDLLEGLTDLDALWRPVAAGESCVQFSSYDRKSDAGPGDAEAWFANGDRGQFLRTLERDGRTEHVLVDAEGPGAVVRIWSANPSGRLFFYLDGAAEPRWEVDFKALLCGAIEGLGEPLCGTRSRGANCHLPVPFADHLVVTSDSNDFYYQVNVRRFGAGVTLDSFDPAWLTSERAAIDAAARRLTPGGTMAEIGSPGLHVRATARIGVDGAAADGVLWSRELRGPGVLRGLRLRVGPSLFTDSAQRSILGRRVRLTIDCDGERTVDVPFADFFGSAPGFLPWGGLAIGVGVDGFGYVDFPMPCAEKLVVALVADGGVAEGLRVDAEFAFEPMEVPADSLRFRASWHLDCGRRTRPFGDHLVLDATRQGRYVGTTLVVRNPTKAWWGEGDEKITVDGEAFPSTFGTGTEDYFGYAWCCPDLFDHPLHAQPQCDGPKNFGYVCNVRLHVADQVPFSRSLKFDLEVWHWQDVVVDYATVAYWYGAPGASSGLPAMPDVEARMPVEMEVPVSFVVEGVLEGEALRVLKRTGGTTEVQDLSGFSDQRWSRDSQLWWVDGKPGDRLELAVNVAAAGRYQVQVALTTAPDYGIVQLFFGTVALGEAIDLYTPGVRSTGAVELGVVDLAAGQARFCVEITGRNEKAIARHMFGLDYLKLVPVR